MRSLVRETVFKFIYSRLFNNNDEGLFDALISKLDQKDKDFAKDLLKAYEDTIEKNSEVLRNLSKSFSYDRIYNVDRTLILLGMAELDCFINTPTLVIIDEYVKLSAVFSTDNSVNFVNAILANYSKERKDV